MDNRSRNKVSLIGRLGADPELKYVGKDSDLAVVNLSVATNESFKQADGNYSDNTEWHDVTAFRGLAEFCNRNMSKGNLVSVEGKLKTRNYEDKNGQKQYRTYIEASDIINLVSEGNGNGNSKPAAKGSTKAKAKAPVSDAADIDALL